MNAPCESATRFKKGNVARRTEAGTAQRIYTVAASLDGFGMNFLRAPVSCELSHHQLVNTGRHIRTNFVAVS
jgi:hypothetical protein